MEELGLEYQEQVTAASVHASFAVQDTDAYLDALLADQRAAARVSVAPFLCPRSIALVGASDKPASIGALLLANLLASGFTGPVYPVNPRHQVIQGVPAYPDLSSCPQPPDLALVAVPAPLVAGVVDQAGRLGVRAVCVISAGFAETGAEGRVLQDQLRRRARAAGVRLIGPNCMGLLSGGPDPRFNATFSTVFPPPGRLAFVSQSGGLGLAALALFTGPSLGVSGFVSVGNTADLTPNDLLLYWDEDPGTSLILAYLESVPDPRRFARIARRLSRHKPIVVVKSGRTGAGRRAASSHTAAMAARETAVEALVHQAGVIRAGTLEEMFDIAAVMSSQPAPAGRRVAVLTNVGGPGILVADGCEAAGLLVPELSRDTQAALRAGLPGPRRRNTGPSSPSRSPQVAGIGSIEDGSVSGHSVSQRWWKTPLMLPRQAITRKPGARATSGASTSRSLISPAEDQAHHPGLRNSETRETYVPHNSARLEAPNAGVSWGNDSIAGRGAYL